jgi:hypothetical protein
VAAAQVIVSVSSIGNLRTLARVSQLRTAFTTEPHAPPSTPRRPPPEFLLLWPSNRATLTARSGSLLVSGGAKTLALFHRQGALARLEGVHGRDAVLPHSKIACRRVGAGEGG